MFGDEFPSFLVAGLERGCIGEIESSSLGRVPSQLPLPVQVAIDDYCNEIPSRRVFMDVALVHSLALTNPCLISYCMIG